MTPTLAPIDDGDLVELVRTANQPGFWRWRSMVAATGGCADPIHLVGHSSTIDAATGEVLHRYDTEDEPNRRLLVACRNRRASRCAPCAEMYRADTYHLIRAGLAGGKSVPDSVAGHPRVFATLTAPSFGAVHHRVVNADGKVERCHPGGGCNERHRRRRSLSGPGRRTRHAMTTPAQSSGTPWPVCCGIAPPRSSSATWPASSASPKASFAVRLGCPTARWPSSRPAAWSTST